MNRSQQTPVPFFVRAAAICGLIAVLNPCSFGQESQFLSRTRQLTFEGKRSGEGYFSSNGHLLIFQSERESDNPFYQIYILDFSSGETRRISPGLGKTTCGFFRPHSDEVLFSSTHLDRNARSKQQAEIEFRASGRQRRYSWDYDAEMEIFSARNDGSSLKRLTSAYGYDAEASYSPDGAAIVFSSIRDAYPSEALSVEDRERLEVDPSYFAEIYTMKADGANPRRLTFTPGYDGGPFFSPDGKRIIWRRFNKDGTIADVYTMASDGTDVRQLTDFNCMAWAPFFHPSSDYAIFTANKRGFSNFELFLVDVDGARAPVRVTFTDGFDGLPVFSPDGRRICWTSNRTSDGTSQLFLAQWNHAAALGALREAPARLSGDSIPDGSREAASKNFGSIENFRDHVRFLASDELEGRLTGSEGSRRAAEYAAEKMIEAGLKPLASARRSDPSDAKGAEISTVVKAIKREAFFEDFEFNAGVEIAADGNHLSIQRSKTGRNDVAAFDLDTDFRPLSFTDNARVESAVVFAGYGLSLPGEAGKGYDSYSGLNVSNKTVLVFRYTPEAVSAERKQELNRYSSPRYKALIARNHGAAAMLLVSGPNSPNAGSLAKMSIDSSLSGSGIVAASIGTNVADAILRDSGKTLRSLQDGLDTENPHAESGFEIPNVSVTLGTAVRRIKKEDRNVLAVLPPGEAQSDSSYVLLGAHYDHLGRGQMSTLARNNEEGQIHNGADDNASGVSMVLELAKALSEDRSANPRDFRHGVIFALWSGEELGLLGSARFTESSSIPMSNLVAYVNFDMVGRLRENKLILQGVGSSTIWSRLIEKRNIASGFDIALREDPYLPTDATSLYAKGVPVLNFFTGSHEDYHRPSDDPETLNYEGLVRIGEFARSIARDLAGLSDRPEYVKVERTDRGGGRDSLRVYLGTIPDYATEVNGVKLSGVRGGSPAAKGGLRGMDVIVEFGGQRIANIYDYTYALDAAKIGVPVKIVVMRDGERTSLEVIPGVRE